MLSVFANKENNRVATEEPESALCVATVQANKKGKKRKRKQNQNIQIFLHEIDLGCRNFLIPIQPNNSL